MTDAELIEYLRNSSDPDDQELCFAWEALQRLEAQRDLTPLKRELVEKLGEAIAICLDFFRRDTAYDQSPPRPVLYPWRGPGYWQRLSTTNDNETTKAETARGDGSHFC
jgi:hypothetical protein